MSLLVPGTVDCGGFASLNAAIGFRSSSPIFFRRRRSIHAARRPIKRPATAQPTAIPATAPSDTLEDLFPVSEGVGVGFSGPPLEEDILVVEEGNPVVEVTGGRDPEVVAVVEGAVDKSVEEPVDIVGAVDKSVEESGSIVLIAFERLAPPSVAFTAYTMLSMVVVHSAMLANQG